MSEHRATLPNTMSPIGGIRRLGLTAALVAPGLCIAAGHLGAAVVAIAAVVAVAVLDIRRSRS